MRWPLAACLAASTLALPVAQDRPPQIRSGIELVTVDVQVVDGRGVPIPGLGRDDFEVWIDGRKRAVTTAEFLRHGAGIYLPDAAAGASAPPTERPAEGAPGQPRRMFVIAVDEHSIGMGAAQSAMQAVRRFISRVPPGDLVGLFAYPTGTAKVDLTTDRALVLKALEGIAGLLDRPLTQLNMSASEAIDIASGDGEVQRNVTQRECRNDRSCAKLVPIEAQSLALMFEMKIARSLGGLRGLVDGLATIPGRKTLVLVSGGLLVSDRANGRVTAPGDMTAVGRAAAASNTTIYALHMDSSFLDAFSASRGGGVPHSLFRDSGMFATGLEMIAGANGGDVLRIQAGTADSALDRVLRETSAHYLLGVEIAESDRDGEVHPIRVRVKRRGLTVRARASVMVPRQAAAQPGVTQPAPSTEAAPAAPPAAAPAPVARAVPPAPERGAADPAPADLDRLLGSSARYLEQYERDVPGVVSEEDYIQRGGGGAEPPVVRRLRSDVLTIADDEYGWIGFRDVYEVDGHAVRGRDQRLVDLFLKPNPERFAQARRIVDESARYNLSTGGYVVQRTINMPMTALRFLRGPNQPRSRFKFEGIKKVDGLDLALVSFEERARPRLIASQDDAAARGRFWIEPSSGRVVRSELSFETGRKITVRSLVRVQYADEPKLKIWMPVRMQEEYFVRGVLLEGKASYGNFRRFTVATSTEVKDR